MDSFEFNKVLGALLGALTLLVGVLVFSDILFEDHAPETPGYIVEVPEEVEGGSEVAEFVTPLPVLLASASVEDGESFVRACASCHNFGQGEPNKVGPHLYDVHNRQIAAVGDFGYSEALEARSDEAWTFENLDGFLADPRGWAPGTIMGYAGIRRDTDRANVLAYLNSLSANPEPLPTEEEAAAILAEAQAAFDAEQGGGEAAEGGAETEGGEPVETDEAIEPDTSDASEVKVEGGDAETPTPESDIQPVVTGEDIAVEENEDTALTGENAEAGATEATTPAPVIDSASQSGEETGIETDPAAVNAVPSQQTSPATPNVAAPGEIANPNDEVERSGAEGYSPAAAQPGPSPGVEAEDTSGTEPGTEGQLTPQPGEEQDQSSQQPAQPAAPAANGTAPAGSDGTQGNAGGAAGAQQQGSAVQTTSEPTPTPNVTTSQSGGATVNVERTGEPEIIIVPSE